MNQQEIVSLVQSADRISPLSRAAMLVEYEENGDLKISTQGTPLSVGFMTRRLRNLLNNE